MFKDYNIVIGNPSECFRRKELFFFFSLGWHFKIKLMASFLFSVYYEWVYSKFLEKRNWKHAAQNRLYVCMWERKKEGRERTRVCVCVYVRLFSLFFYPVIEKQKRTDTFCAHSIPFEIRPDIKSGKEKCWRL